MPNVPVHFTDLQLLHNFFCSNEGAMSIYDPQHRLQCSDPQLQYSETACFNLSANGTGRNSNMKFYFGNGNWKEGKQFIYVNNPDGTMRWLIPADIHSAPHLSLYNASSWKARIYKMLSSCLFHVGSGSWLASGTVCVEQNIVDAVERKYGIVKDEEYALFTGTRGNTRKIVVAVSKGKKVTHFIKIPVSEKSQQLIENEIDMLKELSKYDFTTLSLPRISDPRIKAYARLSNVKPAVTISAQRINDIHIRTLTELYAVNHETKSMDASAAWSAISNNMEWMQRTHELENGLDELKTRRIIHLLRKLYETMPTDTLIPVSVSHGDFTPWNMYCSDHRLYVYDWELSSNGIPMLFDLYHFIMQSQVLIHREDYSAIKKTISETLGGYNVQRLINRYRIDTALHYRLYLLFTISHYLRLYINEKELLMQSHWMIDIWMEALEDVNAGG